MVDIGKLNTLKVVKDLDFGIYLDGGELGEILMPRRYVPANTQIDDDIEVFIYLDSEDRLLATTEKPYAMVGDFAYLEVVGISSFGAFLDWGLPKDLLVPISEQKTKMGMGESYVVRVYLDEKTNRIAASSKIFKYLELDSADFHEGMEVDLLITQQTDLGFKAIINSTHEGVLYGNEIFQPLRVGQKIKGFIQKVRDDEKIDLSLYKPGYEKVDGISQKILDRITEMGGYINVADKSTPETIYDMFGISKKTYKKAIGALYKKGLIGIGEDGVWIIEPGK